MTSPLYATGVGLVMKGFDYLQRHRPRITELRTMGKPAVKDHSKNRIGSFFTSVLTGASDLLKDDDN